MSLLPFKSRLRQFLPRLRKTKKHVRRLRRLAGEVLEDRRLLAAAWRNPVDALDVTNDHFVVPFDVLQIINEINSNGARQLPVTRSGTESIDFVDVTGDGQLAPIDALVVINALNAGQGAPYQLQESATLSQQVAVTIGLGQTQGSRLYRFEIDANFDRTDLTSAIGDSLIVSIVSSTDSTDTLLDRGINGTSLFTLSEEGPEFIPGLVRFDGRTVEVDFSALNTVGEGRLLFQLVNGDGDLGTQVTVRPTHNELDPEGTAAERIDYGDEVVVAGAATAMSGMAIANDVHVEASNLRFNGLSSVAAADLRLRNDGASLGSRAILLFPSLPQGVTLTAPAGNLSDGTPYLNFQPAIPRGGLMRGSRTDRITVEFSNPGAVPLRVVPQVRASANQPPTLAPIPAQMVHPGGALRIPLGGTDLDGDSLTYSLVNTSGPLPTSELSVNGMLVVRPALNQVGQFSFAILVSDGALEARQSVELRVVSDPITSTRVSGQVLQVNGQPLANMPVEIGAVQGLTMADGSFTLDLGSGPVVSDTLKVRGELYRSSLSYPFIAEKLPLLLEHEVFPGVNNVIDRPIYLPALDLANGMAIDPMHDTTVTTNAIPGASVMVKAGTLMNQQGTPFTGVLSITEVPPDLTPAALPEGLIPDIVVTIQPGEMVFGTPAPLDLPNTAGWPAGSEMDLWSINPTTGDFDVVGKGRVTDDGTMIKTIEGGIRTSSWHFWSWIPEFIDGLNETRELIQCGCHLPATSEVDLFTGTLLEDHSLVTYSSQGETRGVTLRYDSQRAAPQTVVRQSVKLAGQMRWIRRTDGGQRDVAHFVTSVALNNGRGVELVSASKSFSVDKLSNADNGSRISTALLVNLQSQPTGIYKYAMSNGVARRGSRDSVTSRTNYSGKIVNVNRVASPFGSGWGVSGLLEVVETAFGDVLLIDGDGSEKVFAAPTTAGGPFVSPPGEFSKLMKTADGTFRLTTKYQTVYQFDSADRLASMTDRNGNQTRYEYGPSGIERIIDPVGLTTTFAYENGRVASITDPANRVTRLAYDATGNLERVTDPDGSSRTWSYDADHRMTGEIDQLGRTEQTEYNEFGQAVAATRKDGSRVQFNIVESIGLQSADPSDTKPHSVAKQSSTERNVGRMIDSRGTSRSITLDTAGQLRSSSDSLGSLGSVERNSANLITKTIDSRGNRSEVSYDDQGNPLTVKDYVPSTSSVLRFDGVDDYVDTGTTAVLNGLPLTIEAWVQPALRTETGFFPNNVISNDNPSLAGHGFGLNVTPTSSSLVVENHGTGFRTVPNVSFVANTWYHIAVVYTSDSVQTFVDGKLVDSISFTAPSQIDGVNLIRIGKHNDAASTYGSRRFFKGAIDEVRVWNVARTEAGILATMNKSASEIGSAPGLVAYFPIEQISGTQLTDDSANNAHGTIRGAIVAVSDRAIRQFQYDPTFSILSRYTDELGHGTRFDLDPSNGNLLAIHAPEDRVQSFTYLPSGQIDLATDPRGIVTDYDYDARGRVDRVTMAKGNSEQSVLAYEYDAAGNVTARIDENQHRTEFEYDANNRLTLVRDALNQITRYEYDARGNQTKMIDGRGNVTNFRFDERDRLVRTVDAQGQATSFEYDNDNNLIAVIDPLGHRTVHKYDARSRRIESIDPDNGRTRFGYDVDGNLTSLTDPVGNKTAFDYDPRGRQIRELDPLGVARIYEYDRVGNLTAKRIIARQQSVRVSDFEDLTTLTLNGNATTLNATPVQVSGATRLRMTNSVGQGSSALLKTPIALVRDGQATSFSTRFQFQISDSINFGDNDGLGADGLAFVLFPTSTALGNSGGGLGYEGIEPSVAVEFDTFNNGQSDGNNGNHVGLSLDGNIRSSITAPVAERLNNGQPWTAWIDYDGSAKRLEVRLSQSSNRPNDALVTASNLNLAGFFKEAFVGFSAATAFGASTHDILSWNLDYIATERPVREIQYVYDEANRLVTESWSNDGNEINYTYDPADNLTAVADESGVLLFDYDARHRVTSVNTGLAPPGQTPKAPRMLLSYTYDPAGNVTAVADTINGVAGATTGYEYDSLDRLKKLTQSGTGLSEKRVDFTYNPLGQYEHVRRFSDLSATNLVIDTAYAYDNLNRIASIDHRNSAGNAVSFFHYTYDAASRITQITDIDGVTDYGYDNRDQLTRADHTPDAASLPTALPDESYRYDANGNRLESHLHGTGYRTGPGNRLLSDGTYNYEYDAEGNTVRRVEIRTNNSRTYRYDHRNRLVEVINLDPELREVDRIQYTYDALDRRIARTYRQATQESITYFVNDREDVILDFEEADGRSGPAAPQLTERYLHGPDVDEVFAQETPGSGAEWLLADHLGTVRDVVSNTNTAPSHSRYESFGAIRSQSDSTPRSRFGFTGREHDDISGDLYYRSRFYAHDTGRFTQQDGAGFLGGDANLFRYAGNRPIMFVDSFGFAPRSTNRIGEVAKSAASEYVKNSGNVEEAIAATATRELTAAARQQTQELLDRSHPKVGNALRWGGRFASGLNIYDKVHAWFVEVPCFIEVAEKGDNPAAERAAFDAALSKFTGFTGKHLVDTVERFKAFLYDVENYIRNYGNDSQR